MLLCWQAQDFAPYERAFQWQDYRVCKELRGSSSWRRAALFLCLRTTAPKMRRYACWPTWCAGCWECLKQCFVGPHVTDLHRGAEGLSFGPASQGGLLQGLAGSDGRNRNAEPRRRKPPFSLHLTFVCQGDAISCCQPLGWQGIARLRLRDSRTLSLVAMITSSWGFWKKHPVPFSVALLAGPRRLEAAAKPKLAHAEVASVLHPACDRDPLNLTPGWPPLAHCTWDRRYVCKVQFGFRRVAILFLHVSICI